MLGAVWLVGGAMLAAGASALLVRGDTMSVLNGLLNVTNFLSYSAATGWVGWRLTRVGIKSGRPEFLVHFLGKMLMPIGGVNYLFMSLFDGPLLARNPLLILFALLGAFAGVIGWGLMRRPPYVAAVRAARSFSSVIILVAVICLILSGFFVVVIDFVFGVFFGSAESNLLSPGWTGRSAVQFASLIGIVGAVATRTLLRAPDVVTAEEIPQGDGLHGRVQRRGLAIATLVVIVIAAAWIYRPTLTPAHSIFSQPLWRLTAKYRRVQMSENFLARYGVKSLTARRVVELLGPPDFAMPRDAGSQDEPYTINYVVGDDGVDPVLLEFLIGEHGTVSQARIRQT